MTGFKFSIIIIIIKNYYYLRENYYYLRENYYYLRENYYLSNL